MKRCYIIILILSATISSAQDLDTTYWRKGGLSSLTFSHVSLTNWAGGGQNSISINANVSLFANYIKGRVKWENSMDVAYGLIKQGSKGFSKSDDKLNVVTKYGYQIKNGNDRWFFSTLLDFRTQFDEGFDAETGEKIISDFMAPGYLTIGAGIDYSANEFLSFSYIPVTGKFTFVTVQELSDNGDYGVEPAVRSPDGSIIMPGKNSRAELGSFFRVKYKKKNFESRLELFSNYLENISKIDVNWQNALIVHLTKVFSANFFTQLIYDDDIKIGADDNNDNRIDDTEFKSRIQFKSVMGLGLAYQFGGERKNKN